MKKLFRLFTAGVVTTILLFNSCTPEDEIVIDLAPKLTNGSWAFSSLDAGSDFLNGGYEILYDGNVMNFSSDGSFTDKLNVLTGTGSWILNGNQTALTLTLTYDDGTTTRNENWRIISITDSELVYDFDISPNTLRMRYTH